MTKIKFCGMRRKEDIAAANELRPDYIGFVFFPKSRRAVSPETAAALRKELRPEIQSVGVFVNEKPEQVAALLNEGVIDMAQLHGQEDETYLSTLRKWTRKPLIQAFQIHSEADALRAEESDADLLLLDAGAGDGKTFDWRWTRQVRRPFLLAGGLDPDNVGEAVDLIHPYGVDVSSGIETDGWKDQQKMRAFLRAVRERSGEA